MALQASFPIRKLPITTECTPRLMPRRHLHRCQRRPARDCGAIMTPIRQVHREMINQRYQRSRQIHAANKSRSLNRCINNTVCALPIGDQDFGRLVSPNLGRGSNLLIFYFNFANDTQIACRWPCEYGGDLMSPAWCPFSCQLASAIHLPFGAVVHLIFNKRSDKSNL